MLDSDCECCVSSGAGVFINSISTFKQCYPKEEEEEEEPCEYTDPEDTSECPVRYSTRVTTTTVDDSTSTSGECDLAKGILFSFEDSRFINYTITTTETCGQPPTTTQSGSSGRTSSSTNCVTGFIVNPVSCSSTLTKDGWKGDLNGDLISGPCYDGGDPTTTVTYSDPISDEETLTPDPECEETEIPFPEFPDKCQSGCQTDEDDDCDDLPDLKEGQGYSSTAFDFSINGEIFEQKFKYKIVHSAPSTCYLKVWTREKIYKYVKKTPDLTDLLDPDNPCYQPNPQNYQYWEADEEEPFSYEGEQTYIWSGPTVKNGLCVDHEKGVGHCDNYEESSVRTVNATNGQEVFLEMKYSFVEGYEPDWPDEPDYCKPNGFPNINCE
jgi:hypothetical protein